MAFQVMSLGFPPAELYVPPGISFTGSAGLPKASHILPAWVLGKSCLDFFRRGTDSSLAEASLEEALSDFRVSSAMIYGRREEDTSNHHRSCS
jgi:hypothetical protein